MNAYKENEKGAEIKKFSALNKTNIYLKFYDEETIFKQFSEYPI